ncbi:MAG: hypothetical protein IJ392_10530 [Clostridia bacterium]|nr:hypothetical protein [Clostridia bacterium]
MQTVSLLFLFNLASKFCWERPKAVQKKNFRTAVAAFMLMDFRPLFLNFSRRPAEKRACRASQKLHKRTQCALRAISMQPTDPCWVSRRKTTLRKGSDNK